MYLKVQFKNNNNKMQEQVIHKLNQRNLKKKRKQQRKQVKHQLKNLMVIFKSQLKINLKKKKGGDEVKSPPKKTDAKANTLDTPKQTGD